MNEVSLTARYVSRVAILAACLGLPCAAQSSTGAAQAIDVANTTSPDGVAAQLAYVKSDMPLPSQYGRVIAVDGDTIAVGCYDSSSTPGVGTGPTDADLPASGAVYVFVRDGNTVVAQAFIKASNPDESDWFGFSVALSGDLLVVGAPRESSSSPGVNGDEDDDSLSSAGAAYVFVRDGARWSQQAYLKASNPGQTDYFGEVVAIDGDTIVVGARLEDSGASGVDGDQGDAVGFADSGAAYVFVRDGTNWSQQAYLKASNTDRDDWFGAAVAVDGDTVVVGANGESSASPGVNGDQSDNSLGVPGAAYVFVRNGTSWSQQAYVKPNNPSSIDEFGAAVVVRGDVLFVGSPREESSVGGIDPPQDDVGGRTGAVYLFERSGAGWNQTSFLKASDLGSEDRFGHGLGVSADGQTLVVGAFREDGSSTGVGGDPSDNGLQDAGAAYVFARGGPTWRQTHYLKASNPGFNDRFGMSVGLGAGGLVAVGAPFENSDATGVNAGDQSDDSINLCGAVYAFDLDTSGWIYAGWPLGGVAGWPSFVGVGDLTGGSANAFELSDAAPNALAALFVSASSAPAAFKGGTLFALPPAFAPILVPTDGAGTISLPLAWPTGVPAGTSLWAQWAIADAAAPNGVALSNAVRGITP